MMSRNMLALVVAMLALYNSAVKAQGPTDLKPVAALFPTPNAHGWALPEHPMNPKINPSGFPQDPNVPMPVYQDAMFKDSFPGNQGYIPKGVSTMAMGVRTEANSWLHDNMHPGMLPPTPKAPEPLYYRPVYTVMGASSGQVDIPQGLTVPVASLKTGYVDTPDAANPSPFPPSWNILMDPVVPMPPILPSAPVPPQDPSDKKKEEAAKQAVLMEIQARTEQKEKDALLQTQAAELARLRAAAAATPVPMQTVTTTTYYANPYAALGGAPVNPYAKPAPITPPVPTPVDVAQTQRKPASFLETAAKAPVQPSEDALPTTYAEPTLSYKKFKRDFNIHNHPKAGNAVYEVNEMGNRNPIETMSMHLPAGWHEEPASFAEIFRGAEKEHIHESPFMKLKREAEATALKAAEKPAAEAATEEAAAEEPAAEEAASFLEHEAEEEMELDEELLDELDEEAEEEVDNQETAAEKATEAQKASAATAQKADLKPRHTNVPAKKVRLTKKEKEYRKQLLRDAVAPLIPGVVPGPVVHQVIPLPVPVGSTVSVTSNRYEPPAHTVPLGAALRSAANAPVARAIPKVPSTKIGLLSEFIHAAKNKKFDVPTYDIPAPFAGSMLAVEENQVPHVSSGRPHGIPNFAAMRAPPQ